MEENDVEGKIEVIALVYFDEHDVVRHNLLQRIIKAYDEYDSSQPAKSAAPGASSEDSRHGSVE